MSFGEVDFANTFEPPFQWYSLEMTLQSGLDKLVALKELEALDVGLMNHRIGVPKLERIVKHWPKFQRLYGLFLNR